MMEVRYGLYMSVDFEEGFVLLVRGFDDDCVCAGSVSDIIFIRSHGEERGCGDVSVLHTGDGHGRAAFGLLEVDCEKSVGIGIPHVVLLACFGGTWILWLEFLPYIWVLIRVAGECSNACTE